MRKINKDAKPPGLTDWKRSHPRGRYADLPFDVRQEIRSSCVTEQFFLCAYCCTGISHNNGSCHNEHVEDQNRAGNRTLDHSNIVASCNNKKSCGETHKSQELPLTPLMNECETELKFYLNGRVDGLTERAKESIKVLNLGDSYQNNRYLIETRKQLVDSLIYQKGEMLGEIKLLDEDLLQIFIDDINTPQEGKLRPFSPVLVNILRNWLAA